MKSKSLINFNTTKKDFFTSVAVALAGIAAVLLPLFFLPITRDVLNFPKQYLLYAFDIIGVFLILLRIIFLKELNIRRSFVDYSVMLFLVVIFISAVFSVDKNRSYWGDPGSFVFSFSTAFSLVLWFWIQTFFVRSFKSFQSLLYCFLISGSVAGLFFLFSNFKFINDIFIKSGITNTTSINNSLFGVLVAVWSVISLGLLLSKEKKSLILKLLSALTLIINFFVLLKMDFFVAWVTLLIGLSVLIFFSLTIFSSVKKIFFGLSIAVLIAVSAFVFLKFTSPLKTNLPVEISLGAKSSWLISSRSNFGSVKNFFIGSGPATFVNIFSLSRDASYNSNQLIWSTRFINSYSSILNIFGETGVIGVLSLIFIIALLLGVTPIILSHNLLSFGNEETIKQNKILQFQTLILLVGWITLTAALFFHSFDFSLWFCWWWLVAMIFAGVRFISPRFVVSKIISINIEPQYRLAYSFGIFILLIGSIAVGIYFSRIYLSEYYYNLASKSQDYNATELNLDQAISYWNNYTPLHIEKAKLYLLKAKQETEKNKNPETVVQYLATAVNEAKVASDISPRNVATWENLSLMYLNARPFAKDANQWAQDSLQKAINLEPSNAMLAWYAGQAEEYAEKYSNAADFYKQAIKLKPDFSSAYISLSGVLEKEKKIEEAIMVYAPIMKMVEKNSEMLFNLGKLFYNRSGQGDLERAEQVWLKSVELSPEYANSLYSLGMLYEKKGDLSKAKKYYQQVFELNPDNMDLKKKLQSI